MMPSVGPVHSDYAYTRLSSAADEEIDAETTDDELLLSNDSFGADPNSDSENNFDAFLTKTVGEFGLYQQFIVWLLCLPACFISAFSTFDLIFIAYSPKFNCSLPIDYEEFVEIGLLGEKWFFENNDTSYAYNNKCTYTSNNGTRNGTEEKCSNFDYETKYFQKSIITEWNLVCDRALLGKTILGVMNIAGIVAVVYSYIQDKWGRKTAFLINLAVFLIGSGCSLIAWNPLSFAAFKFIAGISCMWEIGFVWALEFAGPSKRTLVATILSVVYGFANMSLALIAWLTGTWRIFGLCTSAPFAVLFLFACFVPESPRWLLAEGRLDETARIVERMSRWQRRPVPYQHIFDKLSALKSGLDEKSNDKDMTSIWAFFKSRNLLAKNLLLTFISIAGNQLYYAAAYDSQNLYPNFYVAYVMSTVVEAPATLLNLLLLNRFGRIMPLSISFLLSGLCCLATWPLSSATNWPIGIVLLTSLSRFFICAGVAICEQLGGEMYPTVGRGVGMSVSYVFSAIANMFVQYLIFPSDIWVILPLLIMGSFATLSGILAVFLPETKNKPLPDTVQQAEAIGTCGFRTFRDNLSQLCCCFSVVSSNSVIADDDDAKKV